MNSADASLCPPPRIALGGGSAPAPNAPASARTAVSQGRAAAEGGGRALASPRGFNRTAARKTVLSRHAQALPGRVAWTARLCGNAPAADVEAAVQWFETIGARVDEAAPAFDGVSALFKRCHGAECARSSGGVFCFSVAHRSRLHPCGMAILVLALALLLAPDDGSPMVEAPISPLAFKQQLSALSHR